MEKSLPFSHEYAINQAIIIIMWWRTKYGKRTMEVFWFILVWLGLGLHWGAGDEHSYTYELGMYIIWEWFHFVYGKCVGKGKALCGKWVSFIQYCCLCTIFQQNRNILSGFPHEYWTIQETLYYWTPVRSRPDSSRRERVWLFIWWSITWRWMKLYFLFAAF